uniref:MSP domain-containing protein n=1 Tax=Meloidogyne hapla TaxID=6305 RepID=A0A1I8B5W2_MELHA
MKIEDKYCNSNWVAHVLVLNRANNKSFRYKVKDIRGNKKEINYLFSPPVNFCGVSLENGKEYLIGG